MSPNRRKRPFKFNGLSRVIIVKATIVQRIVKLGIVGIIKRRSVLVVLEFLFRDGLVVLV